MSQTPGTPAAIPLPEGAKLKDIVPPGVVTGDNLMKLLQYAKNNKFAIPAVNCTTSSTINATLQAARDAQSPIMCQFSNGGAVFYAGKGVDNKDQKAAILGSIAGALHVRAMAKAYGVPVVLHSDHCAKKLLPWFDGMLEADEEYFKVHGEPLFSSHMLDLSEEPLEENIEICEKYLKRLAPMKCLLEMEQGITGGEEDGVNNEGVDESKLYSQPNEVYQVYSSLLKITNMFTMATAFGNVHGVYKPGNVKLSPHLLAGHQKYTCEQMDCMGNDSPIFYVFHGGSGSTEAEIAEAVTNGVVKMNVDTDMQWAYWDGVRGFEASKRDYLQGQIGNPDGEDKPNKKHYDPRTWVRKAEESMIERVKKALADLNCVGWYA